MSPSQTRESLHGSSFLTAFQVKSFRDRLLKSQTRPLSLLKHCSFYGPFVVMVTIIQGG